ncbi:hypothetical protein QBZ16_003056 [Prototheca wickerhamii]|uniref:C-CAP/cofactor C-like domain-containing protein n=1 Tax=Prototheca wickerhamii TaxID=3111 RepID=A0AAD9ML95_PROWI|nr:hypothetical protein QBZ16_003056 [Prototheca wickerhamii]
MEEFVAKGVPKGAPPKAAEPAGKPTGMAALFADLNRGTAVTSGLRKVTDDMKTKNRAPEERSAGQKWTVEHQVGVPDLVIAETEPKQTVYVFGCRDSTIQVRGKVNAISLDRCTKVGLLFESVVSSVELVNCASVAVQCTGTAPTLAIDACDGVQVYLAAASAGDTDITTAKSSSVNITVPGASEEDEPVEVPVPEQFVTRLVDGKWSTHPVSHSAG